MATIQSQSSTRMKFLLPYLRPHWPTFLGILALGAVNQFFSLMDPQVLRWLTDNYLTKAVGMPQDAFFRGLLIGLGGLVGVAMVSRVAKNFQDYFANVLALRIGADIYRKTLRHALALPYAQLEDRSSGEIVRRIDRARTDIQLFLTQLVNVLFLSAVTLTVVIAYAFWTSWIVGLAFTLVVPVAGSTLFALAGKIRKAQEGITKESARIAGGTTETMRNLPVVKALGLERQEYGRLENADKGLVLLELNKIRTVRTLEFIQGTSINAVRTLLLGVLAWMIWNGSLSVGEFLSLFFYSFFIFGPLAQAGALAKSWQEAKAGDAALREILELAPAPVPAHPAPLPNVGSVAFEGVTFGYPGANKKALDGLSFQAKAGETVAFVGPSGAGKSTVVKLLAGLYAPDAGRVMVGGVNLLDVDPESFRHKLGLVPQDAHLFSGTIASNLRFASPNATEQQCWQALREAALGEFVEGLADKLEARVGEGGLKLSGGQKQRLAIARALLRDPQVIIFDEATSSLDSIAEKEIGQAVERIRAQRPKLITVLIAHRLSTVMGADRIYVLEKGKAAETGTHAELVAAKGLYWAMWREQAGAQ